MPGTLPDVIEAEIERLGISLREAERRTHEANERLAEQGVRVRGKGLSSTTFSSLMNRSSEMEPDLRTLRLLAMVLQRPLRVFINALGYPVDSYEALGDARQRTLAMVEAAPDDVLCLIDRITALSSEHKEAVAAFLDYLEARKNPPKE